MKEMVDISVLLVPSCLRQSVFPIHPGQFCLKCGTLKSMLKGLNQLNSCFFFFFKYIMSVTLKAKCPMFSNFTTYNVIAVTTPRLIGVDIAWRIEQHQTNIRL